MLGIGIDIGSTATKVAVLNEAGELVRTEVRPTGFSSVEAAEGVRTLLEEDGCLAQPHAVVATGYGRVAVPYADKVVTEITCHGKGAARLFGGDGVVVATATGSTGYALSAGGPLVSPGYDGLVVVPIAPHTLRSRSIVTNGSDVVEVSLLCPSEGSYPREATLFVDGEPIEFPAPVRHIYVRRGDEPTILLRYQREGFYEHVSKTFF